MIVKYVRQFPRKKNDCFFYENEEVLPAKAAYSQLLKPEMIKEYTEKKRKKDYLYPLVIEMTQRYGMVDYEAFFSKEKK